MSNVQDSEIQGTWCFDSANIPGEVEFMHFTSARVLHAVLDPQNKDTRLPMKLWYEEPEPGVLRVRPRPDKEPWICTYVLEQDDLLLRNGVREFRCRRVLTETEPDWFHDFLRKCNERMDQIEAELADGRSP